MGSNDANVKTPLVSIVVPALNEALTIGEFVEWCKQGLAQAGVEGEICIVDSSTDETPAIARARGARVISVPKQGLGQAYIDALPHVRGQYVIMGDCDLTYDFRELKPFVAALAAGNEFVMGTRMKGRIEQGAMPFLHRYFGTPLTTWLLNFIYRAHYSDIHCGMRGIRLDTLRRMNLESSSWEYASEMVLKAVLMKLRTAEIPIAFYKDREGRSSHHKRMGWFSPWHAGWINLKVMFMYYPSFFLKVPGLLSSLLGGLLLALLLHGQVRIGQISLSVHGMLLGMALLILGYSSLQMGLLSEVVYDFIPANTRIYKQLFTYNRGTLAGLFLIILGMGLLGWFAWQYMHSGFVLTQISKKALLGLAILILGFQTFTFTLLFQMITNKNEAERKKTDAR